MLALALYAVFGTRAALADVTTELIVGLVVIGGSGGGRRLSLQLLRFLREIRRRRVPALRGA
jgi:hypothetical protein